MSTVSISKTYEIPDDLILDVIIDMGGYGINYWSNMGFIDTEARTYTVQDRFGDFGKKVLTFDDLATAFVQVAMGEADVRGDLVEYAHRALQEIQDGEQFPGGDIDADVADVIIQHAAFGEIVYG